MIRISPQNRNILREGKDEADKLATDTGESNRSEHDARRRAGYRDEGNALRSFIDRVDDILEPHPRVEPRTNEGREQLWE